MRLVRRALRQAWLAFLWCGAGALASAFEGDWELVFLLGVPAIFLAFATRFGNEGYRQEQSYIREYQRRAGGKCD